MYAPPATNLSCPQSIATFLYTISDVLRKEPKMPMHGSSIGRYWQCIMLYILLKTAYIFLERTSEFSMALY